MIESLEVCQKWKKSRNAFFLFYKGKEAEREKALKDCQNIIKIYAKHQRIKTIEAILFFAQEETGFELLHFLAAGFELLTGKDYTIEG